MSATKTIRMPDADSMATLDFPDAHPSSGTMFETLPEES